MSLVTRMAAVLACSLCAAMPVAADTLSHGRFEHVDLRRPQSRPQALVLLLSDRGGDRARLADTLTAQGAMVAIIDTAAFFRAMESDAGECQFASGDMENLSRFLQAYTRMDGYLPPLLVGQGIGAGLAYGLLAQSPAGTFGGGIGIDFCPQLAMRAPLCRGAGLQLARNADGFLYWPAPLRAHFAVLQSPSATCDVEQVRRFVAAVPQVTMTLPQPPDRPQALAATYRVLAGQLQPERQATAKELADLPVVEVPSAAAGDSFAILISGDGGWAGIDKEVAGQLASQGVPVVGVDSLRYFWAERTPQRAADDIARLIRHYRARWKRDKVWLLGYSQGGDVLPFILNRLPPATRESVALAVPMAMGEQAHFEFHLSNWIGSQGTYPIRPEMDRLAGAPGVAVICAREEQESVCRQLDPRRHRLIWMSGGHHFDGDYAAVAKAILKAGGR